MRIYSLLFTLFFVLVGVSYLTSEPGFNGTSPGCSGSGCHTLQTGIVSATVLSNNQVRVTLTGNSGNVAGELVNSGGTVVAVMNSTSTNPFILTAPSAGTYTVNAGYKSPSRVYGTTSVNIVPAPPAAPTNLSAVLISSPLSVSLQWTDNASNEEGFIIERETAADAYTPIDTVNAGVTGFIDLNVSIATYRYRVMAYNAGGNSAYSNVAEIFVPVELTGFTCSAVPGRVTLSWQTATELDNKGFEIQRKSAGTEWKRMGWTDGNGTSSEPSAYTFIDKPSSAGHYYYRLKQVDFNGSHKYSQIIETDYEAPAGFSLSQNYPNPFNPTTMIEFTIPEEGVVTLSVYNVLGKEVTRLVNDSRSAGTYRISFDASSLSSGLYFYKLSAGGFEQTRKMVLIK